MQTSINHTTSMLDTLMGTVERIDVVQREVTVVVGKQLINVDVPTNCAVLLRGERVKLRIIQVGDSVRIRFLPRTGRRIAERMEVMPVNSLPVASEI